MRKSKGIAKRVVATACSAAMAVAFAPAIAFADGTTTTSTGADAGNAAATSALTIQTEAVDAEGNELSDPVTVKSYTQADLDNLAKANTSTLHYEYGGHGAGAAGTLVTTSKYVTVDQIVKDAGVSQWKSGSSLSFVCADGPYGKYSPTYEEATSGYYYPSYTVEEFNKTGAEKVPAVVTLSYKKDSIDPGATASEVAANSKGGESADQMYAMGTQNTATSMNMGRTFPNGVNTIIVKYQPTVTVQTQLVDAQGAAVGQPKSLKSYTFSQLGELAKANTTTQRYVYAGRKGSTLVTTSKYVTLDQLMKDAGASAQWTSGSTLSFTCADGPYTKATPTYEQATGGYYYPNYTTTEFNKTGKVAVPAVLALASKKDSIEAGALASDVAANSTAAESAEGSPMFAMGTLDTADAVNGGNTFPTGVETITVNYKQAAPAPAASKKANTLKLGRSKVTVKKGKSAKVAVRGAKGKVTVRSSKAKVAKASYSAKTKKVTIKGLKKGTATVTVRAAGNASYKAAGKTIKVTVKK